MFIVDFFPFSNDYSVLRSYFGANVILDVIFISNYVRYEERQFCAGAHVILDITFISNYVRYEERQFCANTHAAGSEVN